MYAVGYGLTGIKKKEVQRLADVEDERRRRQSAGENAEENAGEDAGANAEGDGDEGGGAEEDGDEGDGGDEGGDAVDPPFDHIAARRNRRRGALSGGVRVTLAELADVVRVLAEERQPGGFMTAGREEWLYVLALEGGCFYVGKSRQVLERHAAHVRSADAADEVATVLLLSLSLSLRSLPLNHLLHVLVPLAPAAQRPSAKRRQRDPGAAADPQLRFAWA